VSLRWLTQFGGGDRSRRSTAARCCSRLKACSAGASRLARAPVVPGNIRWPPWMFAEVASAGASPCRAASSKRSRTCSTSSTSARSPKIRGQKPQSFAEANDTPFAMLSGRRPAKRGGYQAAIGVEIHMARAPSCGSSLTLARGHNCGSLDDQSSKIGKM